ncbi:glycerol-3-phosphate 1-O-acyltransferase PlsY [Acidobacteriota bacterium]
MKIFFIFFSYFLGSLPTGYIIFYISEKKDIRLFGSHSTGATNLFRLKGWKYALPVLLVDIVKGFLPVFLALKLFPNVRLALICAFFAVFGHCFPVYLKFKGGKGVATTIGVYAALMYTSLLLSLIVFLMIVAVTRYVSLGSLLSVLSFPFFVFLLQGENGIIFLGLVIFVLIFFRHWSNIRRLINHDEKKLGAKI